MPSFEGGNVRFRLYGTRMTPRLSLLISFLSAAPVLAEAGLPNSFCTQQSCSCGAATCSCGQVCNLNQQTCASAQSGFCASDGDCAASCDDFICEGNVCTRGVRSDAGAVDGGLPGATPGGPGCGCTSGAGALAVGALLLVGATRRRRHGGAWAAR